jgi:hypothetical protein
MIVTVLNFGSNWWARFGSDPADPYRYTRSAAFYNSTGIRCGGKVRRHWIVPGLVRFNGVGGFNPHFPGRALGCTFLTSDLALFFGGNRLLFRRKLPDSSAADWHLVAVSEELHGRIDFNSAAWKSHGSRVIAASQLRQAQEVMLLMKPGDWVGTVRGLWRLSPSDRCRAGAELVLDQGETAA